VQRWPEAVIHSWGSYFGHVPYGDEDATFEPLNLSTRER